MPQGSISSEQIRQYHDQGFVLAREFFNRDEIEMLHGAAN